MDDIHTRQAVLSQRIGSLEVILAAQRKELSQSFEYRSAAAGETEARLAADLFRHNVRQHQFCRVPWDYYDRDLEYRKMCLQAASINHLCKSIIFENTKAHPSVEGCSNPNNSKYYCVIVQYTARFHSEKLKRHIHKLNDGLGIKWFNMRLAPDEDSFAATGYGHNAVTPVGMTDAQMPIVLSHRVLHLHPPFFWMGGGEVDLKLGVNTTEFVAGYSPMVIDCTYNEGE